MVGEKKLLRTEKKIPPLYVTCGEEDMLYEINTEFKDYLKENGVDVTWVSVPGYTHESEILESGSREVSKMDSENRRICVCRSATDLIRPMKTEKWCGDNLFGGVSAPFF